MMHFFLFKYVFHDMYHGFVCRLCRSPKQSPLPSYVHRLLLTRCYQVLFGEVSNIQMHTILAKLEASKDPNISGTIPALHSV